MECNYDTHITEKQLTKLRTLYENKSKIARNLIRHSLDVRHKIKAKIGEDKERAASLLQILERLDEYEKVVKMQLEAAEKMEDPESLKKLEIIKKYESMVREQREVWAKYEEEYEQLPMAKERRKVTLQLLKTSIQVKLLNYKIEEKKKMINLKNQISKRKEQFAIINFAKFMVEYNNRDKHYRELRSKVNALKKKEQELQVEIQQMEQLNINRDSKINVIEKQPCMKSLTLPPMDLSCYIVSQKSDSNNHNYKNADAASMYSFNLEQEYMNGEADDVDKDLSKASAKSSKIEESNFQNNEESQETYEGTLTDVNSEELLSEMNQENVIPRSDKKGHSNIHNNENSKKNSEGTIKKSGRDASKKRACQNQVSEDYSNCDNTRDEQRNSRISTERPVPTPAKMPKHVQIHEGYSNCENTRDVPSNMNGRTPCSPEVAAKVRNWQRTSSPKKDCTQNKINRDPLRQHPQQQQHHQQQSQHQFHQQKLQRQQHHQEQQQQHKQRQHQQQRKQLQQQQQRQSVQQQQQPQQQQQRQPVQQQQQHQQQHQPLQEQQQLQQQQRQPPQQQLHQQQQLKQQQQRQLLQQKQQQMSWSPNLHQNAGEQNFKRDLTGLPQSNKPLIISNERVHYDAQFMFQKQQVSHHTMKQHVVTPMDISQDENEASDAPPQPVQETHSASNQNKPSRNVQSEQPVPPQYRNINADSMLSVNMYSTDTNMSADNISAIIGSDITEPGGAIGLVNHLHGDPDDISEDVDLDFDHLMSKFCSPLLQDPSKLQQQAIDNGNNQNSVQFNEAAANHDPQEHTKRNFVQFGQKSQSNPSQRFF